MSEAVATGAFDAHATALEDFDVSSAKLMQADQHWDYFARLRDEAPVHYCKDSMFGSLLVDHPLCRHYGNREELAGLLFRSWHHIGRPP